MAEKTGIAIYPDDFAAMLLERAGQPYQPSNGTEGVIFMESWCAGCARDKSWSEGKDFDACEESEICRIIGDTMAYAVDDPKYPREWQYGKNGQPCCTAFVPVGQSIAPKDELTIDMFAEQRA